MGFSRAPRGLRPEKSAPWVSCGDPPAAFEPGTSTREEAAAALCRKRRRVVPKLVVIKVFSSVEKTFSWRRHALSSRMRKKSAGELNKSKGSERISEKTTPCEQLEYFSPEL